MTDTLYLYATISGTPIAISTDEIEAVVRLGDIVPVHRTAPHVRGLASLRSRVLTVIDLQARVFGRPMTLDTAPLAIVSDIGGHSYGLLVETVADITTSANGAHAIRGRIDPVWESLASALVERDGQSHLVLHVSDCVTAPATAVLAA